MAAFFQDAAELSTVAAAEIGKGMGFDVMRREGQQKL